MQVRVKFKMQADIISGVVMDIAAFKISHSVGIDKDATALRAARARSSSIGAMERYTWVRFAGKLTPCHTHSHGNGQHTSGAMEEMSGNVQNASTHILRRRNHEHTHSSWSVRGSVQGAMEELSQKVQNASTHILRRRNHEHAHSNQVSSVGQFKGEFKGQCGAMEEMS